MQTVQHYVYKYGSDAAVREMLAHDPFFQPNTYDYQNARVVRQTPLKQGVEVHDDVVINGRYCNTTEKRLEKVKPWDMLLLLGHGQERELVQQNQDGSRTVVARTINPFICRSDDAKQTRTVADVVSWLAPKMDNLSKDHVLFKMVICFSGGEYRQQQPSDCFAKQMAIALARAKPPWPLAIVAGYKGEVRAANDGFARSSRPKRTPGPGPSIEVGQVEIEARAKMVVDFDELNPIPAKENLFYFHGPNGDLIGEKTVAQVKRILRNYPGEGDLKAAAGYLKKLKEGFDKVPACWEQLAGKVTRMLFRRLAALLPVKTKT
jgi:hypothetical protein